MINWLFRNPISQAYRIKKFRKTLKLWHTMLSALSLPPSVSNTHFQEKTSAPCTADHHFTQHTSSPHPAQSSHCLLSPITPVKQLNSWPLHGFSTTHTTEQLHFHFSLSCVREGNGNPLQCSCLENPRDRGAWWDRVGHDWSDLADLAEALFMEPLIQGRWKWKWKSLSHVPLFATPWTIQSMEFSRPE